MNENTAVQPAQKNAGAVVEANTVKVSREVVIKYLQNMGTKLPQHQFEQFVDLAVAQNLNPFKREIYAIAYGNNFNTVTGYEVYLKRADRTDTLDGWKVWTEGTGPEMVAKILIHRKDRSMPFEWEVEMSEYDQKNSMWKSKPKTMLKKVVVGQGFRLCFPDEFDGLPYLAEEIGAQGEVIETAASEVVLDDEPAPDAAASRESLKKIAELLDSEFIADKDKKAWLKKMESTEVTQEKAEKAIAQLTRIIIEAEKARNDEAKDQEKADGLENARKRFHAMGVEVYGESWDEFRKEIVKGINPEKESSNDLDRSELLQAMNRLEIIQQEDAEANNQK